MDISTIGVRDFQRIVKLLKSRRKKINKDPENVNTTNKFHPMDNIRLFN